MLYSLKEVIYCKDSLGDSELVFVGDIGGTNSNFGLCSRLSDQSIKLIASFHTKSRHVESFPFLVRQVLERCKQIFGKKLDRACFGVSGVVSYDRRACKPTNLQVDVETRSIIQATSLVELFLINDFEAVAYGIDYIDPLSLIKIKDGICHPKGPRAAVGAGTGLGKVFMIWDRAIGEYCALACEGGHADVSFYDDQELSLGKFINTQKASLMPISWEDVLSGRGIVRLYQFLNAQGSYSMTHIGNAIQANGYNPDHIFSNRDEDILCKETFNWFARFYGRCIRNYALETLARGGMYIGGGIAAKNRELFTLPSFLQELTSNDKQRELLESIPLTLIADYNVSLYGAARYIFIRSKLEFEPQEDF